MENAFLFIILVGVLTLALVNRSRHRKDQPYSTAGEGTLQPFEPGREKLQQDKPVVQGSVYVVDGDTVVIRNTQIRLFGIDAPEINHPHGKKAKWALVSLCKGQTVRAEITEQDAHGRTVARCYLEDGRDLSAEMVKLGLAIDWPKFSGGRYRSLEMPDARRKLWLAAARQRGRMHVWDRFKAKQGNRVAKD